MVFTQNFTLTPIAPYDFGLSAELFAAGDRQVRAFADGIFYQVLMVNGKLVLASLTSAGTIANPKINATLKANSNITKQDITQATVQLSNIFHLNFSLTEFYQEIQNDTVMANITQRLEGYKTPAMSTAFEALVNSIVEQQIAIKVAFQIENRLAKRFGEKLTLDKEDFFLFPTPKHLSAANIDDIRQCGLSARKAEYIKESAQTIVDGKLDFDQLNLQSAQEIIKKLDALRGIGVWTAELTMLKGMQRLDALPADDFGIRRVISTYYCSKEKINGQKARLIAENWGKWKGLAAFYLIVAEAKGIVV
jgi:DNA-3-methyladenine glycosylase II